MHTREKRMRHKFRAMGTWCSYEYVSNQNHTLDDATLELEVKRLEAKFSRFLTESFVGQVNLAAGTDRWIPIDDETIHLLNVADSMYQISDRCFDITSVPLQNLWAKSRNLPDKSSIGIALALTCQSKILRNESAIQLPVKGMSIDLGSIVKEYATDRLTDMFISHGVIAACINMGGDIRVFGGERMPQSWAIGVQDPWNQNGLIYDVLLENGAIATSGTYERFNEINAQRHGHIINARTGMPSRYWESITVVAPNCLTAGGVATLACLLEKEAIDFLENQCAWYFAISSEKQIFKRNTSRLVK